LANFEGHNDLPAAKMSFFPYPEVRASIVLSILSAAECLMKQIFPQT
jgi:hypothetical protein